MKYILNKIENEKKNSVIIQENNLNDFERNENNQIDNINISEILSKKLNKFLENPESKSWNYNIPKIFISFVELYNEDFYDLFYIDPNSTNLNSNQANNNNIYFLNSAIKQNKKKVYLKEKDKFFYINGK